MYLKHNKKVIQIPKGDAKSSVDKCATDMNQLYPIGEYRANMKSVRSPTNSN